MDFGACNLRKYRVLDRYLTQAKFLRQEYRRGKRERTRPGLRMWALLIPLAVQDQGGDGARAKDSVRSAARNRLVHEEWSRRTGSPAGADGRVVVLLGRAWREGMEARFFRAGGAVRDSAAEFFHYGGKWFQFSFGFDAFGHVWESSWPYLTGLSVSTISSIPPGHILWSARVDVEFPRAEETRW